MTNGEAIDYIRCALSGGCHQVCNSKYRGDCTDDEVIEAVRIVTEAVEKQIPKKPNTWWDGYADGCPCIEFECPNCGHVLDETDHHCVCGQAIDWDEEE